MAAGDLSAGVAGLSITFSMTITSTLNWLVRNMADLETNIVSVERIQEYTNTQSEDARHKESDKEIAASWPDKGSIKFENYSLRYREGLDLALKDLSFQVNGGEFIGIAGRTGAGKSSLSLALFRIVEAAQGDIEIDGIKIKRLGLNKLRHNISIIPQDPVLFSGTLRLNLDPLNNFQDDEIWKALEQSHLKAFAVERGLNHEITEGGENLSVGQRQLLCLSRALLRKSKILILDEATAAVDLETDALIQKTIKEEFRGCTVLAIAHRLSTIIDYDKILVLKDGELAEFDTPNKLLENKDSIFYSMCKEANLVS